MEELHRDRFKNWETICY